MKTPRKWASLSNISASVAARQQICSAQAPVRTHLSEPLIVLTPLRTQLRAFLARRGVPTHDPAPVCDIAPSAQGESMKLVRFGPRGREKPGIVDSKGGIRDLSKVVPDIAGDALSPKGLAKIRKTAVAKLPLVRGNP